MNAQPDDTVTDFLSGGQLNRVVGWVMVVAGLLLAAALDPWLFDVDSAADYTNSNRPAVRHAQGVVFGMALLQLAIGRLLAASDAFAHPMRRFAATLTALGAIFYTAGYALGIFWPAWHGLVLLGSMMNFCAFAALAFVRPAGDFALQIKLLLPMVCFGMLLDFTAGVLEILPQSVLGADDDVRLRMMRLARVAAIALSVLTLLFYGMARRAEPLLRKNWGGLLLAAGAIGMPTTLVAASFISLNLKYLLPLPATAVVAGVSLGFLLSLQFERRLESWGWGLILGSTLAGMLMGFYAFEGPLAPPEFLGEYNDTQRQLSRIAHSYCVVFGVLAIFLARALPASKGWGTKLAASLFMAGSAVAISMLVLRIALPFSYRALSIGPMLAAIGIIACLGCAAYAHLKVPGSTKST